MKILHLCLASFYIDHYSYQENLLPLYHKKMGLDVEIIASLITFDADGKGCLLENSGSYINENQIPVTRLDYKKTKFSQRLRRYEGTYEAIFRANPDIIFIHGCQFLDIKQVVKYVKQRPEVKIYVDNHADFSNSARSFLSKNVLHKIVWKNCARIIEPYTDKFYGVLPARVDFLKDIYKLPGDKTDLLVMGAADEKVKEAKNEGIRRALRDKYKIKATDFLLMTGGKIDQAKKQTLTLMKAVKEIDSSEVKLIVFGWVVEELKSEIDHLADGKKVQYIGWIDAADSYRYFEAADLVVFPGRHSVFWEQVVALGKPMVVKYWEGTTHIDIGGNVKFLYNDSLDELRSLLYEIINNKPVFEKMKLDAAKKKSTDFLYSVIAKKSIGSIPKTIEVERECIKWGK